MMMMMVMMIMMMMTQVPALTEVERTRNWRRRLTDEKAAEVSMMMGVAKMIKKDDHDGQDDQN